MSLAKLPNLDGRAPGSTGRLSIPPTFCRSAVLRSTGRQNRQALGLAIPEPLLATADEVIQ